MPRLPSSLRSRARLADAVGLVMVGALALWVAFVAGDGRGRPGPVLWLLVGLVLGVAAGRALARNEGVVPRMVASGVAGAIVVTWPGTLGAGGAPLGYANANATLSALGALAAIGAAGTSRSVPERHRWLVLAAGLCVVTASTGSFAGALSLAVALVLLGAAALARWPLAVIGGGLIVLSTTLAVTSAVAAGGDPVGLGARSEVRGQLWTAAVDLAADESVRGIGPGEFADRNPVSDDADLRWAHHGFLQVAAELGVVGLGLVLALVGWVSTRLWITSAHAPVRSALGGAAALVVGIHATVDYVWHVPAVMLVLAALLGGATAGPTTPADREAWQSEPERTTTWV